MCYNSVMVTIILHSEAIGNKFLMEVDNSAGNLLYEFDTKEEQLKEYKKICKDYKIPTYSIKQKLKNKYHSKLSLLISDLSYDLTDTNMDTFDFLKEMLLEI